MARAGQPCKHATETLPVCEKCQANRAKAAAWVQANRGRHTENTLRWARKHRRKKRAFDAAWRDRNRASKRSKDRLRHYVDRGVTTLDGTVTIESVYRADEGICWRCGDEVPEPGDETVGWHRKATIDHVLEISKGGQHTDDNCRLAHQACNVLRYNEGQRKEPDAPQAEESEAPF